MPEYLSPGVYVEEVSFRSKSIEGVPTSTTGFAGMTRFGPVRCAGGPRDTEPRLITSFTEFETVYGGLERIAPDAAERECYLAHAARAFFLNGGKRLYVSRVFVPRNPGDFDGVASLRVPVGAGAAFWRARWPGAAGNFPIQVVPRRSKNVTGLKRGAVVEITAAGQNPPGPDAQLNAATLSLVTGVDANGTPVFSNPPGPNAVLQLIELQVTTNFDPERPFVAAGLATHPDHKRWIGKILGKDTAEDENAPLCLDVAPPADDAAALALLMALTAQGRQWVPLVGGNDGRLAQPDDLMGAAADPDNTANKATGLEALGEIDDIAIVALPDGGTYEGNDDLIAQAADRLITHAESQRYRIAIVDGPKNSSLNRIRTFRGRFDTKYAALYHPWIEILDPTERATQGAPPRRIELPPSGFVAGIYARSDIERGVFKAPANEVVRGLTRFEININKGRQDVLNPEGINALRFFEGRGNRVWGARTMSSDPEWIYVNVRRLFIYLEHSIDKSTQWAVFEPNNERLWANIRQTVEDFLLVQWKNGALLGSKPEEAYFVRCDRTTMTQNDLDNGRLICLIGVAPTKPAEFVIFRIGQWTYNAKLN